jgi:hypothetical protein
MSSWLGWSYDGASAKRTVTGAAYDGVCGEQMIASSLSDLGDFQQPRPYVDMKI